VDLGALRDKLSGTIERAKADDPRELRRRIAELQKAPATETVREKRVEVPAFSKGDLAAIDRLSGALARFSETVTKVNTAVADVAQRVASSCARVDNAKAPVVHYTPRPVMSTPTSAAAPRRQVVDGDTVVDGPMRKILGALAQFGPMDKSKLALLTGYTATGGGFNNPMGRLRTAGLITPKHVYPIAITEAGAAHGPFDSLPDDGDARFALWLSLPSVDGPMRKILTALRDAGGALDKEELAKRCGYEATGGGFNNPMGRLRTLGLVSKGRPTLAPELIS
jgi:hypothetical protein